MGARSILAIFLPLSSITAYAQNLYSREDLDFAKVDVGGGYETVLIITNRGSSTYTGTGSS